MSQVVLLSGGIDSLVCAELARAAGSLAGCVFVDYGHPAQVPEGWKAFAYCGERAVPLKVVHVFGLDLGDMGTHKGARVVPSRNAVLLSAAANVLPALGGESLVVGVNADDADDYEDCRPAFVSRMSAALGVPIAAPLMGYNKRAIVAEARRLGLSPSDAWSCYTAGPTPCGECPSCRLALDAWSAP